MTALNLYVNTLSLVFKTRPYECTFTEVYNSFACLRETLLCPVCRKLLDLPTRVYTDMCHHNVCKACKGNLKGAIPQCYGCGRKSRCQDNVQLRVVMQCYKKMCKYMISCGFFQEWTTKSSAAQLQNFIRMANEGSNIEDDFHFLTAYEKTLEHERLGRPISETEDDEDDDDDSSVIHLSSPKVGNNFCKRKLMDLTESDESSDSSELCSKCAEDCLSKNNRGNCRCGLSMRNPNKRTCHGQRCSCYITSKVCFNSHCRDCRSPQKCLMNSQGARNLQRAMNPSLQRHRSMGNTEQRLDLVEAQTSSDEATTSDEVITSDSEKEPSK